MPLAFPKPVKTVKQPKQLGRTAYEPAARSPLRPVPGMFRMAVPVTADIGKAISHPKVRAPARKQAQPDIRGSARGEACTVRIEGVCNFNSETTVWSHGPFNDAGKGMGIKGLDLVGCYSCSACHDVVDGRAPRPTGVTKERVMLDWFYGMTRSLVRLMQKGLL
jgi:hypothetical protein